MADLFDQLRTKARRLVYTEENVKGVWTEGDGTVTITVLDDSPGVVGAYGLEDPKFQFVKGKQFRAYDVDPGDKFRPAPGGVSVGHYAITAGTLGSYFSMLTVPGDIFMLSNAHVLANENLGKPGDAIYQPGKYHGGGPDDTIAHLTKSVKLENTARNVVDAAIAKMINRSDADLNTLGIGRVYGAIPTIINQDLYKYGTRTFLTRGVARAIDAVLEIGYATRTRIFEDCVISTVASGPGDSGSLICDLFNNYATSLLFAGGNGVTVSCKFENVQRLLGLGILPFTEVLRGLITDVSHWQWPVTAEQINSGQAYAAGNMKVNIQGMNALSFAKMKSRGTYAVIAKAFQPPDIYDDAFQSYCEFAEQAEILKTAYGFCDPEYSWQDHLNGLKKAIGGLKMDFSVMWDWEFTNGKSPAVITSLYQNLNKATEDWQGKKAINYSSPAWYNSNILPFNATPEFPFNDYDLPFLVAYWSENALAPLMPTRYRDNNKQQVVWQVGPRNVGPAFGVSSKQIDLSRFYPGFRELLFNVEPPPDQAMLTITIEGQGAVMPAGGNYPKGETVFLTATPAAQWQFDAWKGDVTGNTNTINVLMDTDKAITAVFTPVSGSGPAEFIYNKGKVMMPRGINLRAGAGVTYTDIGDLAYGEVVGFFEQKEDNLGNNWIRTGHNQWCAQHYGGQEYVHILQVGEV